MNGDEIVGGATFKVNKSLSICNLEYFAVSKEEVRRGLGYKIILALKI